MRGVPAGGVLDLWESASRCGPHERAVRLLAWALPEREPDELADLDLGLRDWHLLALRRALFGPRLAAWVDCPSCGERLEIALDARELLESGPPAPAPVYVSSGGQRFRLPSSRDLIAVSGASGVEDAERELFARCALADEAGPADPSIFDEVDRGLAALSAERVPSLDLVCAVCGGGWQCDLDPGALVWEEIQARALALIDDVQQLAGAYGWSERDILGMSDARRAAYLGQVDG